MLSNRPVRFGYLGVTGNIPAPTAVRLPGVTGNTPAPTAIRLPGVTGNINGAALGYVSVNVMGRQGTTFVSSKQTMSSLSAWKL